MIGQSQKIIHAYAVKLCQCNKNLRRNHTRSAFIISICSLRHINLCAKLGLCEVGIFS